MFLVTLYLYNNIQEVLFALQESNFRQDFSKLFMSHCSKSSFPKRYKITILVITFLFGIGFQVWDIQNFLWEVSHYFEAYKPPSLIEMDL